MPSLAQAQQGVRVVEDCRIPDLAMTRFDYYGQPFIIWNSCAVQQVGPLVAAFIYQHELGHVYLRTSNEDAADCYAVQALRYNNPQAIMAFIQLKASQGMGGGDMTHRPGIQRAQFIYACLQGEHGH